jgi:hypothetical protein
LKTKISWEKNGRFKFINSKMMHPKFQIYMENENCSPLRISGAIYRIEFIKEVVFGKLEQIN